jgi:hypothetical protein
MTRCAAFVFLASVLSTQLSPEQTEFWKSLRGVCGNAYAGKVTESPFGAVGEREVIHVREC